MSQPTPNWKVGQIVGIHPAHDLYMQGIKYAEIQKIGRSRVYLEGTVVEHKFKWSFATMAKYAVE